MKRMKRSLLIALILVLAAGPAMADSWKGSVYAADRVQILAPADGILESLALEIGQTVQEGGIIGSIRPETLFSPLDGTIAAVHHEQGDKVDGTVVEISPTSLYTVTCTTSGTAKTPENALIHMGETVWIRCTADGSHRALGIVTALNGAEYTVETTAGELYVGETVYLYRSAAYSPETLIGKGTVTAHDPVAVDAKGYLLTLWAAAGDRVSRGQRLCATASAEETSVIIPADGVVLSISAEQGSSVKQDSTIAELAAGRVLRISVDAGDAPLFRCGSVWYFTRGDDPHETHIPATVSRILYDEGNAAATVELIPSADGLPIGLSVTVTDEP